MTPASESDLSEAIEPPTTTLSSQAGGQDDFDNGEECRMNSEQSNDEDAAGSDDADYDMETSPPAEVGVPRYDRSSSQDSRKALKRKVGLENDEYIMNNPELYGLRRSVGQDPSRLE